MSPHRSELKITYEEYHELPETGPRYQLIDGELIMSPAPNTRHQEIVLLIASALLVFVKKSGLGRVFVSPIDVILSTFDVLQPDIIFISNARRKIIAPEGIRGVPDLCIEVLSKKTRKIDLGVKKKLFAEHGVIEFWVVDPEENWIDVYHLQKDADSPVRRLDATATLATDLIPGFSLPLAEIFKD
jgi:Uma2 family endonuclease